MEEEMIKKKRKKEKIVVQKYGGSSVSSIVKILLVADNIKKYIKNGFKVVVVVSAMGDETDRFESLCSNISKNPSPRERDLLLATGEMQSTALLSMALVEIGVQAQSLSAQQIELISTHEHGNGKMIAIKKKTVLRKLMSINIVPVVSGFQGISQSTNDIVTLGRGASDATAVAIAAELKADICEIYTDVDGVFTVDPRIVSNAVCFEKISYAPMRIMSQSGAGVMMARSIEIAENHGVKIKVMISPSLGKSRNGTLIQAHDKPKTIESINSVPKIGLGISRVGVINIGNIPNKPGFATKIYELFHDIVIDDIAQTGIGEKEAKISILFKEKDLQKAKSRLNELRKIHLNINLINNLSVITLVDEKMTTNTGYMFRISKCLAIKNINIEGTITAESAIGIVIKRQDVKNAANILATEFKLVK